MQLRAREAAAVENAAPPLVPFALALGLAIRPPADMHNIILRVVARARAVRRIARPAKLAFVCATPHTQAQAQG